MVLFLSSLERQVLAGFSIAVVAMAVLHEVVQLKEVAETIQTQILEDHYATLKIAEDANQAEITTAYRRATNQLNSKQQAEDGRRNRANVNAAYETLSNPTARTEYDNHRRVVITASLAVTAAFVGIPVLAIAYFMVRMLAASFASGARQLDPSSFGGKVAASLALIEGLLEVELQKDANSRLGLQLTPVEGGAQLQVCSISSGGLVEQHNQKEAAALADASVGTSPQGMAWWEMPCLRESDIIEAVNSQTTASTMMDELKSSDVLRLRIRRPLVGGASVLPWLCEAELDRSSSEKWGCQLTPVADRSNTLEVSSVEGQGAVARWNEANPKLAIRAGDRVVAVSQDLGCESMLQALRDSSMQSSRWLIARGVLMPVGAIAAEPKEVVCGPFEKRHGQRLGIRIGQCLDSPLRPSVVEPGCAAAMVVKEVVSGNGFLVDSWNKKPGVPKITEGSVVLAVNGCREPKEFAAELSKPSVNIWLRPPRAVFTGERSSAKSGEAPAASSTGAARAVDVRLEESLQPLALRLFGRWAPSFLLPRGFEVQLRETLRQLRCEFEVKIDCSAAASGQLGMMLTRSAGLEVQEVKPGGLVDSYNRGLGSSSQPRVRPGDRLVAVNGFTAHAAMLDKLKTAGSAGSGNIELRFSRPAGLAAPGVWEADIERKPDEGWGMELREQEATAPGGPRSAGVLRVHSVAEGMAIDRWNKQHAGTQWRIEPDDLLVACEPDVVPSRVLNRLRVMHRTRFTFLRWHKGPAPEAPEVSPASPSRTSVEVTIQRSGSGDRLGVRLEPSSRDPTRTAVAEVISGGLVDRHNQAVLAQGGSHASMVYVGDEVDAVNGEGNPEHFAECCKQQKIVFKLSRRAGQVVSPGAPRPTHLAASSATPERLQEDSAATLPEQQPQQLVPASDGQEPRSEMQLPSAESSQPHRQELADAQPTVAEEARPATKAAAAVPDADVARTLDAVNAEAAAAQAAAAAAAAAAAEVLAREAKKEEELRSLEAERDRLAAEMAQVKADAQRSERSAAAARRASEQEAAKLREEISQLRSDESELQARCQEAEQRLAEERAARAKDAERYAELAAMPPPEALASLAEGLDDVSMMHFDEGLRKLQDLSVSLESILAVAHD